MSYTIYEILWLFLIYACIGWCMEVGYCGLNSGKFVNRGFLNGPICPIYGVGGVIIILCLTPLESNILLLFLGAVVVTSLIELITGYVLEKIYHTRWWDYSDVPFNIGGYICLKFSLMWGCAGVILMKAVHPVIYGLIRLFPKLFGEILLVLFLIIFVVDCVVTIISINNLSKRMAVMNDIANRIHKVSDILGQHIYEKTVETEKIGAGISKKIDIKTLKEKTGKDREDLKRKYEKEMAALKQKYASLTEDKNLFHRRILKAFPTMKSKRFNEELEKIRDMHTKRK